MAFVNLVEGQVWAEQATCNWLAAAAGWRDADVCITARTKALPLRDGMRPEISIDLQHLLHLPDLF